MIQRERPSKSSGGEDDTFSLIGTDRGLTQGEKLMLLVYGEYAKKAISGRRGLGTFSHISIIERRNDIIWETKMREIFAKQKKSIRGEIMERFLMHEIEVSEWFSGAFTSQTTDFDDYHGTDLVLEWKPEEEGGFIFRLAVDVTSSTDDQEIKKKVAKLKVGANVKYYRSEAEGSKEMQLPKIPIVIFGIDSGLLPTIAKEAEKHRTIKGKGAQRKASIIPSAFADHPIRFLLLEQARIQIDIQVEQVAILISNSLKTSQDKKVRELFNAFIRSDGSADVALETIGKISPDRIPVKADMRAYWKNLIALKKHIDNLATEILGELEKNTAKLEEVRKWLKASETYKLIVELAAS